MAAALQLDGPSRSMHWSRRVPDLDAHSPAGPFTREPILAKHFGLHFVGPLRHPSLISIVNLLACTHQVADQLLLHAASTP